MPKMAEIVAVSHSQVAMPVVKTGLRCTATDVNVIVVDNSQFRRINRQSFCGNAVLRQCKGQQPCCISVHIIGQSCTMQLSCLKNAIGALFQQFKLIKLRNLCHTTRGGHAKENLLPIKTRTSILLLNSKVDATVLTDAGKIQFFLQSSWIKCLILNISSPNDLNIIIHVESFPEQPPFELSLILHCIKHSQSLIVLMALCWLWLFPPLLVGILSIHRLVCKDSPLLPSPGLWRGLLLECSKSSHGIPSDVQLKEETSTFKEKDFFDMCQLTQILTSMEKDKWQLTRIGKQRTTKTQHDVTEHASGDVSWLAALLLLANDIEVNPGPTSSSDCPKLAHLTTIPDIAEKWKELGARLLLDSTILDRISNKHTNLSRCKREMFSELLNKRTLTWAMVLDALTELGYKNIVPTICQEFEISYDGHATSLSSIRTSSNVTSFNRTSRNLKPVSSGREVNLSVVTCEPVQDHASSVASTKSASTQPAPHFASTQPAPHSAPHPLISPRTSSPVVAMTMGANASRPSAALKTFKQFRQQLLMELAEDPILITNKIFSVGLMTLNQLHDLRMISTNRDKASTLLLHVEAKFHKEQRAFSLFVESLRSISTHMILADQMSRVYRLNLVWRKMEKFSETTLDFTLLCNSLNDQKLISDSTKEQVFKLGDHFAFCHALSKELDLLGVGAVFLDLLDAFKNTKSFRATLRDYKQQMGGVVLRSQICENGQLGAPKLGSKDSISHHSPSTSRKNDQLSTAVGQNGCKRTSAATDCVSASSTYFKDSLEDYRHHPDLLVHRNQVDLSSPGWRHNAHSPAVFLGGVGGGRNVMRVEKGIATSVALSPSSGVGVNTSSSISSINTKSGHQPPPDGVDKTASLKFKKQEHLFLEAVEKWDAVKMDSILTLGIADKEHRFEKHRTALMLAAKGDQKEMTQVLLKHNASVVAVDNKGYSALYLAAKYGNYELVQMVIKEPMVDVNIKSKAGVPLLIRMAEKNFSVITECLLEHGALPDATAEFTSMTALYAASKHGHKDVVKVLLDHHADVTRVCNETQSTPLEEALAGIEPEVVLLLMKAESDVKKKSRELFAAETPAEVRDLVTECNANVDIRDSSGVTPLIQHAGLGNVDVVKKLLHFRANVDLQDNMGLSALIMSCKLGHLVMVQVLISASAILDLKERENGYTALMFSVVGGHVDIVRALVLAKACIHLREKDGKSACDLAKEKGNTEIMEILKVQNKGGSHKDDPFMQLLSSYMYSKTSSHPAARSSEPSQSSYSKSRPIIKKRLDVKSYKPPQSSSTPDTSTSEKADLEKCYKRIADLEIRVQDLTATSNKEPAMEEDVSYMDKARLEVEYKKFKDAKKKAEQYAVEAKQTAQRLSAENFKLREDLNKERHFNELTRKTIIKEVEQDVELGMRRSKLELVKASVFQEEVAERAYQLVQNDPQRGLIYEKVSFSSHQLKDIILTKSVRLSMFPLHVSGLPFSGKTTLCKSLGLASALQTSYKCPLGLDLYQAILKPAILSGHEHQWIEMSGLRGDITATSVMHFLVGQHQLPKFDSGSQQNVESVFDDPEVQAYFEMACDSLRQLSTHFSGDNELEKLLTGSYSLVNVFDVGVSKEVHEIVNIIRAKDSNLLLLDLIDMSMYCTDTLMKPLDLKDSHYDRRYDSVDTGPHSALHHFVTCLQDASCEELSANNCIIVGTHADKFSSARELNTRKGEILNLVNSYSSDLGMSSTAVRPGMLTVDVRDNEQCKVVTSAIVELTNLHKKSFEMDVPLRFIFFRWYLHNTKLIFISRLSLIQRAKKCHIHDEREVDHFLEIFRRCGSIITSPFKADFLYHQIILLPGEFLQGLSRLYYIEKDASMPQEFLQDVQHGIITGHLIRSLWQGSAGDHMSQSDFYISVLQNVGLACKCGEDQYFIPSLISKCDSFIPKSDSTSLIIVTDGPDIPYRKQCEFVKYFNSQEKLKGLLEFKKSPYFNTILFTWKSESDGNSDITIRFSHGFIEVSVGKNFNGMTASAYSLLKTAVVDIMHKISANMKSFRFKLNIVCPKGPKLHFIPFDMLDASVDTIQCPTCAEKLNPNIHTQKLLWIRAAYNGSPLSATHPEDILNPSNLLTICKKLISSADSSDLLKLCRDLSHISMQSSSSSLPDSTVFAKEHRPLEEVLFHALYNWHCQHVPASRLKLARLLRDKGFYKEAITLDSSLYREINTKERVSTVSKKDIAVLADWWPAGVKDLAKLLKVKALEAVTSKSSDVEKCADLLKIWLEKVKGDQRGTLYDLFTDNEYYVSNILSL